MRSRSKVKWFAELAAKAQARDDATAAIHFIELAYAAFDEALTKDEHCMQQLPIAPTAI